LRLEARTFLKQLQRELATTAIFVTHDQSEALALADRMAVMESGVIRQVGTPTELFHRPVAAGHDVICGNRPEYITIDGGGSIRGQVSITENLGTDFLVTVDVDGVTIKATIQEGREPQPGDIVSLAPTTRRVLLYDRESGALL
jgi:multiple sugar transport system ATP-binding protein